MRPVEEIYHFYNENQKEKPAGRRTIGGAISRFDLPPFASSATAERVGRTRASSDLDDALLGLSFLLRCFTRGLLCLGFALCHTLLFRSHDNLR